MRRAANIALFALIVGLVAVGSTVTVPRVLGLTPVNLTAGSMFPTYPFGTLLLVDPKVEPTVGSVITWQAPGGHVPVSHRVMRVEPDPSGNDVQYVTRGDHNTTNDVEPVPPDYIVGVTVAAIPYAGMAAALLGQLHVQIFIAALALAMYWAGSRKPTERLSRAVEGS